MMFIAINYQYEKVMQRKCIIRLEDVASLKIGHITLTSPKMILDFIEENTFMISFNQQRQKKKKKM